MLATGLSATNTQADGPPPLDYFRPFGTIRLAGAPIDPGDQPIVAIVRGQVCGVGSARVATAPPADAGQTVYTMHVLADGGEPGQRAGCGRPGEPVRFYFPVVHRMAQETPEWRSGDLRTDLTLGPELSHRAILPLAASDS